MKKVLKKISFLLCSFIIGAQSKIFAVGQTTKYGPVPDPNVNPQAKYGVPAPTITRTPSNTVRSGAGLGHAQILSILAAILLFFIGLIIALSKGIKKNVKVILVTIISILIVLLMILTMFVF